MRSRIRHQTFNLNFKCEMKTSVTNPQFSFESIPTHFFLKSITDILPLSSPDPAHDLSHACCDEMEGIGYETICSYFDVSQGLFSHDFKQQSAKFYFQNSDIVFEGDLYVSVDISDFYRTITISFKTCNETLPKSPKTNFYDLRKLSCVK